MILSEMKQYLMQHRRVTLGDLAVHFDTEPDAIRGMLKQWIRKGRVTKLDIKATCNETCCKCDASAMEIYEWNP